MEQALWTYIGVIAALLGLLAVAQVFLLNQENVNKNELEIALTKLGGRCDFVCQNATGTMIRESVVLAAGTVLTTNNRAICYAYSNTEGCIECACPIEEYTLDLNTGDIRELYTSHTFDCSFEKVFGGIVRVECTG